MKQTIRTLMSGLIDYAGLFPPASLSLERTIENYARYARGEEEWMLGRLIIPASKLEQTSRIAAAVMPGTHAWSGYREHVLSEPWLVSVVVDGDLAASIDAARAFNDRHREEDQGLAIADALEIKATGAGMIEESIRMIPDEMLAFFEIPTDQDPRGMVAALAGTTQAAKIRCGGVREEMIPSPEVVARFLAACAAAEVPLKATAGLHHPIRARHPLTYDETPPTGMMHGFLNVFLASAFVWALEMPEADVVRVLEESSVENFTFENDGVWWHDARIDSMTLAKVRETFALSYGSCSFEEPLDDLRKLGML